MRHFHVKDNAGNDTGSWSAGPNGEQTKVLAQLTDMAGNQARAVLDIESAIDAADGTPEADELDVLVDRIIQYEDVAFPFPVLTAEAAGSKR